MNFIGKPKIFKDIPEIIFGLSRKISGDIYGRLGNNMSKSLDDSSEAVEMNRKEFFTKLGLDTKSVVIQKQIHSSIVNVVDKYTDNLEGDALITEKRNLGLAVSTADCTNIYIYDPYKKIIAAVHSGWAGTEQRILEKTIKLLFSEFSSDPKNLHVYFAPSINGANYEVGPEFADKFDQKYLMQSNGKYKLDLKSANYDMLTSAGVSENQIEVSEICSFENSGFHSFRRDKQNSGRALGIIAMKNDE